MSGMNELLDELQDKIFTMGIENKTLIQKDFEDLMNMWKKLKEVKEEEKPVYDLDDIRRAIKSYVVDETKAVLYELSEEIRCGETPCYTDEEKEQNVRDYILGSIEGVEGFYECLIDFYEIKEEDISHHTIISMIGWMQSIEEGLFKYMPEDNTMSWVIGWYYELYAKSEIDTIMQRLKDTQEYRYYMEAIPPQASPQEHTEDTLERN